MSNELELERFKTKHLFLLMGTNPLPNYVSAKLLSKSDAYIYFVHTKETNKITDNLIKLLNLKDDHYCKIQTEDADASDIFYQVSSYAKDKEDIGLNYTGGTKIMSVHSYRAVEKNSTYAVFSYLDARELSMRISNPNGTSFAHYPVDLSVKLSISDLLYMHGYTLKHIPTKIPIHPEVCRVLAKLANEQIEAFRSWCNSNLRSGEGTPIKGTKKKSQRKDLVDVKLPDDPRLVELSSCWLGCNTLGELSERWEMDIVELARWLDGIWLEHYTLCAIKKVASSGNINDCGLNIEPKEKDFEFDVAAMRGYQLFAISCTTEKKKSILKQKLFEAYIRARQMGGEEARVGLVCYASPENPDNNPKKIEHELQEEWEAKDKIRVFGTDSLAQLDKHLNDWFNPRLKITEA